MNLYLIGPSVTDNYILGGYDMYDSAVVCARSKKDAALIHPSGDQDHWKDPPSYDWVDIPQHVEVEFIGTADGKIERGVVCASFNQS